MELRNFDEFWAVYLGEHRNRYCRALHYIGTSAGHAIALTGIVTLNPLLIPAGLVVGYGFAWFGHFVIEGNKPASFKYPRHRSSPVRRSRRSRRSRPPAALAR